MKPLSIGDYVALVFVVLFFTPVTLWTVVHAAIWTYGVLIFPAAA